jgi:hypothetical protein
MPTLAEGIGILFSKIPCQCLCSTTLYNALSKYTRKIQGGLYNVAELLRGCLLYSSAYLNAKQFYVFVGIIRREQLSAAEYIRIATARNLCELHL